MTTATRVSAPAAAAPTASSSGAKATDAPPGEEFALALDQARTAEAEGQQTETRTADAEGQPEQTAPVPTGCGEFPVPTTESTPHLTDQPTIALPAAPVEQAAAVTQTSAPVALAAIAAQAPVPVPVPMPVEQAALVPQAAVASQTPARVEQATPAAQTPTLADKPGVGDKLAPAPPPTVAGTPSSTETPAPAEQPAEADKLAPAPPPTSAPATAPQAARPEPTPAAPAPFPPSAPPAPTSPPAMPVAGPAGPAQPVETAHLAERIEHVAVLTGPNGTARATLVLKPVELGQVDIRLRQTAEGLTATVAVKEPEALQAVQHAVGELLQTLEQRGITVQRLDVQLAPQGGAAGDQQRRSAPEQHRGTQPTAVDLDDEDLTTTTAQPVGLVDVRA